MKYLILLVCLLLPTTSGIAQNSVQIGEQIQLTSVHLNEARTLLVHIPNQQGLKDARFPVLYVLDGEWNFKKAVGIVDHLQSSGRIPGLIVVGITNTFRNGRPARVQDLAPSSSSDSAPDGAAKFLSFLADEVKPYINSTYQTHPFHIVAGHSLGGLFSFYSLLQRPEAFQSHIAISPSLGRNNQQQVKKAAQIFEEMPSFKKSLFVSVASEGGNTLLGTQALEDVLKQKAPADFDWHVAHYDEEDHTSVYHPALYNALESIFEGWTIPEQYLTDYDVSIAERHYAGLSQKLGFPIAVPEIIYSTLGNRILAEQDYSYAAWTFEKQLSAYPESVGARIGLGDVHLLQGDIKTAITHYEQALQLSPTHDRVRDIVASLKN